MACTREPSSTRSSRFSKYFFCTYYLIPRAFTTHTPYRASHQEMVVFLYHRVYSASMRCYCQYCLNSRMILRYSWKWHFWCIKLEDGTWCPI